MKTKLAIIISGWIALLFPLNLAYAQAPSSIAGDGSLIIITSGTYPFASYGYSLFIPANSGNSYQSIAIYNVLANSGTYTYTLTGPSTATINLSAASGGSGTVSANFATSDSGTYYTTASSYPGSYQTANFVFASGSAPNSIVGKTIVCTIADGLYPFASTGSYTFFAAASGNTYTVSGGGSGTYSYSLVNKSTGKLQIKDSLTGTSTIYVGFENPSDGGFAITQPSTGEFQIGSFTVLDTTPPTVTITSPSASQRWSNSVFIVTGKAGDNAQVAQVYYQLFGEGWNLATTSNGWTNWSGNITLTTPGTNIIQAYSVDSSGNMSSIASSHIVYVLTAPMTVQTNGVGTVSPNYNGQFLEIGKNYSMTASAGAGFAFTGWTGSVSTNGTIISFTMQSNTILTANFMDVQKPVLSITNLTAGQRWSNLVFTAKGTATDNWQIASVQYQLNGGIWTNATGTTNWSAPLTLTPGTNTFAAYDTDTTGNNSTTNNVSFQFVVTNFLEVQATGLGTISPNYSNSWLEIGRNYSMTATPASGFVVTNWTISTNWLGGRITNSATVQFMMASNLTLQVNFADVTKPTLSISSPTSGKKMTNALANIIGTASDNWKVSGVWNQLNGGAWNLANTTNSFTNWTTTLTLLVGTNTVKSYALDLGGNFSLTNTLSVVSSNTFMLQLTFTNTPPMQTNGLVFNLQLSTGLNGHIQVSTNLTSWTTLTNFVGTNSTLTFRDPAATNSDRRFYRAVIP